MGGLKDLFQSTLPRRERQKGKGWMEPLDYFNPRSREGSDHVIGFLDKLMRISIHAPAKGATTCPRLHARVIGFQSTLPRRERLLTIRHSDRSCQFQSTLPRRERRINCQNTLGHPRFQSTLPRRERRLLIGYLNFRCIISIHAPAKGATFS